MTSALNTLLLCLSASVLISFVAGLGESCVSTCEDADNLCVQGKCLCAEGLTNVSNTCLQVSCGNPQQLGNGEVTVYQNSTTEGFEALYSCLYGYRLEGPPKIICTDDGQWSGPLPVCRLILCPPVVQPINGYANISDDVGALDAVVTYSCFEGYVLEGSQTRTCTLSDQETGQWSGDPPACNPRDCEILPDIVNGNIVYDPDPPVYRSIVRFNCSEGFLLVGPSSLECQTDGRWNGDLPVCNPVDPTEPPPLTTPASTTTPAACNLDCLNGGSCIVTDTGDRRCNCSDGFSGPVCEIEHYCVTQPCPDNAVGCKPVSDGRLCICPVGLKGDNCDEDQIPPVCSPVVTPPEIWVVGSVATLNMDCTDPAIPDSTDHLSYNARQPNSVGFRIEPKGKGVFELQYLLRTSGTFELQVTVENGLMPKLYTEVIEVQYLSATPIFSSQEYNRTVTENFDANTVIVTVQATSAKLIGKIVYYVIGDSSTPGWDAYFTLDQDSGRISTLVQLRGLANQVVRLRLEAEDDGSKLRSATQVEITVTDINEPPQCTIATDLMIDVTAAVGTPIAKFNCSDPDVKPEFKTLTYRLSGNGVEGIFVLAPEDEPTSMVTAKQLSVTVPSYGLLMTVTDGGSAVFSESFTVTVSLLPPPLMVEISERTYKSIMAAWRYDRPDFYSVTNSIKVILTPEQGDVIESSVPGGSGARQFNMTNLQANTTHSLVVRATTNYGIRDSEPLLVRTPEVPVLSHFVSTILVTSVNFDVLYRNPLSQKYFELTSAIKQSYDTILSNTPGFQSNQVLGIWPANSLYADVVTMMNQSANSDVTIQTLQKKVLTGWIRADISVDSGYFVVSKGTWFGGVFQPYTHA